MVKSRTYIITLLMMIILTCIGLNTAAQGLHRLAPETPGVVIKANFTDEDLVISILGESFSGNAIGLASIIKGYEVSRASVVNTIKQYDTENHMSITIRKIKHIMENGIDVISVFGERIIQILYQGDYDKVELSEGN